MADEGIFCTRTDVLNKAGQRVSSTTITEAMTNQFIAEAEAYINAHTGENWTTLYSGLNAAKKGILRMACSCIAANFAINNDYINFFTIAEAQSTQNLNWNMAEKCLKLLENRNTNIFLKAV